jgi:hypothetical protein
LAVNCSRCSVCTSWARLFDISLLRSSLVDRYEPTIGAGARTVYGESIHGAGNRRFATLGFDMLRMKLLIVPAAARIFYSESG